MRKFSIAAMLFPIEHRISMPIAMQKRIPHMVNTNLVMLFFFLLASTVRFATHPEEYRIFSIAVWATSMLGYPLSFALVRFRRYSPASYAGSVSTLLNVCWMAFLLPVSGVSDIYRFSTYIMVAVVCNSLVALDLRQVLFFAIFTVLVYFAYVFGMLVPRVGIGDSEFRSLAAVVFILTILVNVVINFSARTSDELILISVLDAKRNREKAERLRNLLDSTSGSLRIGEELGQKAEESNRGAAEVRSRIIDLEGHAQTLSTDARTAEESNAKIAQFTGQMHDSVISQNEVIHETSAALVEIAATVSNLARVATAKKGGIDSVLAGFEDQRGEMRKVVEGMNLVRASSDRVLTSTRQILDVSEKTDLLAMNASIEAAHQGGAGKGFAVIAQEIRKLSDETRRSTKGISAALEENNAVISSAAGLVNSFQRTFESGMKEMSGTFDAMEEIIRGLSEMETANDELRGATRIMTEIANKTENGVKDVAERTLSSAEGVRRISRFSEELLKAVGLIRDHFVSIEDTMADIERIGKRNIQQIFELGEALDSITRDAAAAPEHLGQEP
jgi:methyl-accepting chemotaxis protein